MEGDAGMEIVSVLRHGESRQRSAEERRWVKNLHGLGTRGGTEFHSSESTEHPY